MQREGLKTHLALPLAEVFLLTERCKESTMALHSRRHQDRLARAGNVLLAPPCHTYVEDL